MKVPGPDHRITVVRTAKRICVRFADRIVADTTQALMMAEAGYPLVYYIPRAETDMSLLAPTSHTTYCPYKGDASYFTINVHGRSADNAVWTYEKPFPAVAEIEGYLAFYRNRVDAIEEG